MTYIAPGSFAGCTSLESLEFGEDVQSAWFAAFYNCPNLKSITFNSMTAPTFRAYSGTANAPCPNDLCEPKRYSQITLITPKGATGYTEGVWAKFKRSNKTELSDNTPYVESDVFSPENLTYTRSNMTPSTYATFCLPFSTDLSDVADKFEAIYTTNGTALYKPDGKLILMLKKIGMDASIPARQAFVGKLSSTATEVTFANNALTTIDELTMQNPEPQKLEVYDWNGTSGLLTENTDISVSYGGALTTMTGKGSEYKTFNSNGTFGPTDGGTVKAFRAYVVKGNTATMSKVRSISLGLEDETTGISISTTPSAKPSGNAVYSIDGTLVSASGDTRGLPSGIYIKGNKKIINK